MTDHNGRSARRRARIATDDMPRCLQDWTDADRQLARDTADTLTRWADASANWTPNPETPNPEPKEN